MQYEEITTDDIDQMFSWGSGWDRRYTQLSAGRLGFATRQVRLPDLLIEWNTFGQAVLFEEVMQAPVLFFGVLLDAMRPAVYAGREMGVHHGLVYHPGHEQEYRVRPGSQTMVVAVAADLWRTLDWHLSDRRTHPIPRRRLNRLVRACEDATAWAMTAADGDVDRDLQLTLRDRVLVALYDVLEPWRQRPKQTKSPDPDESKAFALVQRAGQVMDAGHVGERLNVADLAGELGVSQRVVYDCFARCYGVGPYEFHQLRKLHAFRSAVVEGKPFHGKISQAASSAGFQHLGRLTQLYRRHFGETPRQTMRRRDAEAS